MKFYHNKEYRSDRPEVIKECVNLIKEKTGLLMYDEQIKAAVNLYKGNIVNLTTGGGKTLVVLLCAMLYAREKEKVYVLTTNDYLVKRDYEMSKELFDSLGKSTAAIYQGVGGNARLHKETDIIYSSGQTLVFDYLRGIPAKHDTAILDEIDFLLVEAASNTFAVATKDSYVRPPEALYRFASGIADILSPVKKRGWTKKEEALFDFQYEADVILDLRSERAELTKRGYELLQKISPSLPENKVFLEALHACLQAKHFLVKDEQYIIRNDEIFLVDRDTGRVGPDCHYDICLQTALEIKENLKINDHFLLNNDISYAVFFSLFDTITGISGTANCVPYDFSKLLGKDVKTQNPHFKTQRDEFFEYYETEVQRMERVKELAKTTTGPVLIAVTTDKKAKEYKEYLKDINKTVDILDNSCLEYEKEKLKLLENDGSVLVSNKIVGRGTDIITKSKNGLTVILAQRFKSKRAERQIIGRTGRNGVPGTCYILTCRADRLFNYSDKEKFSLNEKTVQHLQKVHEGAEYDTRRFLYLRDRVFFEMDESVLDKLESFTSYEELLPYAEDKRTKEKLEEVIRRGYKFLPTYKKIIRSEYYSLRPYFQEQFQTYTAGMQMQFLSSDNFHMLTKTYLAMGDDFVKDTLKNYISKIL